jgi:hypothetical protein
MIIYSNYRSIFFNRQIQIGSANHFNVKLKQILSGCLMDGCNIHDITERFPSKIMKKQRFITIMHEIGHYYQQNPTNILNFKLKPKTYLYKTI